MLLPRCPGTGKEEDQNHCHEEEEEGKTEKTDRRKEEEGEVAGVGCRAPFAGFSPACLPLHMDNFSLIRTQFQITPASAFGSLK
jgi:hypothetical protein